MVRRCILLSAMRKMNEISLGVSFHLKQCGKICRLWIRNVCTSQVHGKKTAQKNDYDKNSARTNWWS
jgi:hypothetical protein